MSEQCVVLSFDNRYIYSPFFPELLPIFKNFFFFSQVFLMPHACSFQAVIQGLC